MLTPDTKQESVWQKNASRVQLLCEDSKSGEKW